MDEYFSPEIYTSRPKKMLPITRNVFATKEKALSREKDQKERVEELKRIDDNFKSTVTHQSGQRYNNCVKNKDKELKGKLLKIHKANIKEAIFRSTLAKSWKGKANAENLIRGYQIKIEKELIEKQVKVHSARSAKMRSNFASLHLSAWKQKMDLNNSNELNSPLPDIRCKQITQHQCLLQ